MSNANASPRPLRVLFVCTENAGRSQIAEALLRQKSQGRFEVASAGSGPARRVNPLAIDVLRTNGIDWTGRTPKGFDAVSGTPWDLIITLCDKAREACPTFPGQPIYAHWGMPDPAGVTGDGEDKRRAFEDVVRHLRQRIDFMLKVPFDQLERAALERRLGVPGQADTAPAQS